MLPTTYQAGLLQTRASRKLNQHLSIALDSYHMSVEEWALLGVVNDRQPIHLQALAAELGIEASITARLARSLEAKGYLHRTIDQDDSRARLISLSHEGHALLPKIESLTRQSMQNYLRHINPLEFASYLRVLRQIAELP